MKSHGLVASVASLLVALLLIPPAVFAKSKPLDAATVHQRIFKRGVNQWVCVEQANGVQLVGRIIDIHPDTFTLQLPNDPQPVTVPYASVVNLRTGPTRGFWIFTGVSVAAFIGVAAWGISNFHSHQPQMPVTQPPAFPFAH